MVVHRLSTIKSADKIVFIKDLISDHVGKFIELTERNSEFRTVIGQNYTQ